MSSTKSTPKQKIGKFARNLLLFCQYSSILISPIALADAVWLHQNGLPTNTQSTLKLQSGATVSSPVNPTGATVTRKAASQAPTVVIQATGSGGNVFNYKDDCYIFDGVGIAEAAPYSPTIKRIGAGKVVNGKFTGIAALVNSGNIFILSLLTGGNRNNVNSQSYVENGFWCGSSPNCFWANEQYAYHIVFSVTSLSVANVEKCYP